VKSSLGLQLAQVVFQVLLLFLPIHFLLLPDSLFTFFVFLLLSSVSLLFFLFRVLGLIFDLFVLYIPHHLFDLPIDLVFIHLLFLL
jgi:hypothetical protein